MLVAGIDASTTATGVSIMRDGELVCYKLITIDSKKVKDAYKRIKEMFVKIIKILDQYDVDKIYMEKAICKGGNVDVTIKLAYLSGGISLYCVQRDIEFYNPLPSEWRKLVGIPNGRGVKRDAQKEMAIKVVKDEYGINVNDDIAESILIARSAFDLPKIDICEDDLWC